MRDGTAAARRIELAEIERWFTSDAFGLIFHAADGRAWRIDDPAAARGRAHAVRIVDRMLDTDRQPVIIAVLLLIVFACAAQLLPAGARGVGIGALTVTAFVALHVWGAARLALYSRRLRRLRREIAADMTGMMLNPGDPDRLPRTNLFRVGQHVWVLLCLLAVATAQLRFGAALLPRLQGTGGVPVLLAVAVVLGVAWALYFAAERVDRVQAKPRERLRPLPDSARDSWSQAD